MFLYEFFPKLLNMSLTASAAILFVMLIRLLLKKMPKVISYALWGIVLVRLLCPVSIESDFSMFGLLDTPVVENGSVTNRMEFIPNDMIHTENQSIVQSDSGADHVLNNALLQDEEPLAADSLEALIKIAACVWLAGILAMGIYTAASCFMLRRKLITSSFLRDNIYLADEITSPFVMGLVRPKIYLPSSIEEQELPYILMHEQYHICRYDHLVKAAAFIALCIHWFNPLVWAAFIMAEKDMEMSCDEAVVKRMGDSIRADYAASLLSLATGHHIIVGMPLAFGEGDTKGRIRNLANRKKPALWAVFAAGVVCVIAAVCLLTNPSGTDKAEVENETTVLTDDQATSLGNSIYRTIYEKYSQIAEMKDSKITLTDGAESDGKMTITVDVSMNWTSKISSENSQFLKGMAKYMEEDPNNLVKSAYASHRDSLDRTYNKEDVTGYALLVEFSGDSYSENYKLYDRFTSEEGILKAEFDDTAQTNDRSAFEEGYNFAKSMVPEK